MHLSFSLTCVSPCPWLFVSREKKCKEGSWMENELYTIFSCLVMVVERIEGRKVIDAGTTLKFSILKWREKTISRDYIGYSFSLLTFPSNQISKEENFNFLSPHLSIQTIDRTSNFLPASNFLLLLF